MSEEYVIAKKSEITSIADTIRAEGGHGGTLFKGYGNGDCLNKCSI